MINTTRLAVHILCSLPMLWLGYLAYIDDLGANPIEFITRYSGDWTIRMLLITLTVSPLARITQRPMMIQHRRAIGLWTFFYGLAHFITYIWLDQFFDFEAIVEDIIDRPFILAGFAAFVMLVPLAITSNTWAIRKLQHHWKTLHKLVYVIAIVGLLHYWWLVRADFLKATIYLAILTLLLGYRLWVYIQNRNRYAR